MCKNKINSKHLIALFIFIFSLISSLCNAGNDKPYIDNGEIIFEGIFPRDQNEKDNERKDSVLANILINRRIAGTIETRNYNLELVYCSEEKEPQTIWVYTDCYTVKRITFGKDNRIIRIYYSGAIFREGWFVNEFYIDKIELKKRLLKRGRWTLF